MIYIYILSDVMVYAYAIIHKVEHKMQNRLSIYHKNISYTKCNYKTTQLTHLPPSATYMSQWMTSALVQIMACRLFSAKPLSKPMLTYC